MSIDHRDKHIIIVGGGPVGLFLGIGLLRKNIPCTIIEKRKDPVPDSRSLGIHPVSLDLFDDLGITADFLNRGLKIQKGIAFTDDGKIGEISFENCPKPHNYILACPQSVTESILRDQIRMIDPEVLITEAEFQHFTEDAEGISVIFSKGGQDQSVEGSYLVGCDGKNSLVRQKASIHYSGKRYPDTYIMGDFEDTTGFGADAAVYLHSAGLIECFPLPNGMRRWVAKTDEYIPEPDTELLAEIILYRCNIDLSKVSHTMLSSFGVQHFMAESLVKGRVILAGDSAHVVSPIGGQGMNLGWVGAIELLSELTKKAPDLASYHKKQRSIASKVARRAEINMKLGRARRISLFRNLIIRTMLSPLFRDLTAKLFTMRGLKNWWI
ncbi:FAD-dependent oxidoreductase [Balneola sp. MJW-20]|uniref:FAD-dependent oxidoreductase n=1 Tax=Gracilimonas aurantiaca TaxID=3234185 RepID=UPI0034670266